MVNVTDGKLIRLLVEDEPLDVTPRRARAPRAHARHAHGHPRAAAALDDARGARGARHEPAPRLAAHAERRGDQLRGGGDRPAGARRPPVQPPRQPDRRGRRTPTRGGAAALGAVLVPRLNVHEGLRVVLAHTTRRSGLSLAAGMEHAIECRGRAAHADGVRARPRAPDRVGPPPPGRPLRMTKLLAYHWSAHQSIEWLRDQVDASLQNALAEGWEGLAAMQREHLDGYWRSAKLELDGDPRAGTRPALRAVPARAGGDARRRPRDPARRGSPARATTATPSGTRRATSCRCSPTPSRAWRATPCGGATPSSTWRATAPASSDLRGALFPWRTIHGEECSGYWPAGTAALHVNADIARAVQLYVDVTLDEEFDREEGLELLVETARLWASHGYHDADGRFRIDGVTGPDEYSALEDNNAYTNLLARDNMRCGRGRGRAPPGRGGAARRGRGGGRRLAARGRRDDASLRRAARGAPAEPGLHGARALGLRRDAPRTPTPSSCTTTTSRSTAARS